MRTFYDARMSTGEATGISPSAGKPKALIARWEAEQRPLQRVPFAPLHREQLYRTHDRAHVDAILDGRKQNGFGTCSPKIAKTLLWTSGSLLAAGLHALRDGGATFSPTSGFHHASHDQAMGFCTFNGLIVTAFALLRQHGARRVGIVDCDQHDGNGTRDLLHLLVRRGDLEPEEVVHYTFGEDVGSTYWNGGPQAERWLLDLPGLLEPACACDVVLYQAGADPHVDDPLGGALTSDQLRRRDRIVFQTLARAEVPVAWNLAGGYQRPLSAVLDVHTATLEECTAAWS